MQLKAEIVRDIMLTLEENIILNENLETKDVNLSQLVNLLPAYSKADLAYTVIKLNEANYINASLQYGGNKMLFCNISSITYTGHEFIDSIRDDNVWNDIKKGLLKVESFTLPILKDLGTSLLKQHLMDNIFS